jgi:hypothetical protein
MRDGQESDKPVSWEASLCYLREERELGEEEGVSKPGVVWSHSRPMLVSFPLETTSMAWWRLPPPPEAKLTGRLSCLA